MLNFRRSGMSSRTVTGAITTLFVLILAGAGLLNKQPSQALPEYARRYDVSCQKCHSVAPRLNEFGLAFQANNFNWPGGSPPAYHEGLQAFPISGIATFSHIRNAPDGTTGTDFRDLALYASDGFSLGHRPGGGYLLRWLAAVKGDRAGDLDNAFVALPVAGRRGQWALLAGQMTPIQFSWDDHNTLTDSAPLALSDLDDFSLEDATPGLRLDFFNNRGHRNADGDYLSLGAPFEGHLTFNSDGRLGKSHGVYAQAFRRRGFTWLGLFGYARAGHHLEGLIGSHELTHNLYLWGAAALGHDLDGSTRRLSLQATYVPNPRLGLAGRVEALDGAVHDQFPVVALTVYPLPQQFLRLTAESIQQKANRSNTVFAYVQF